MTRNFEKFVTRKPKARREASKKDVYRQARKDKRFLQGGEDVE